MRRLFRNHGRAGVRLRGCGRQLDSHRGTPPGRAFCRGPDAAMIRVVLPGHLRALARVGPEIQLHVEGPVTQRSVLDALEAQYPMLRGTIRDQDRKSTRLNSSHEWISYAVFCLKNKSQPTDLRIS